MDGGEKESRAQHRSKGEKDLYGRNTRGKGGSILRPPSEGEIPNTPWRGRCRTRTRGTTRRSRKTWQKKTDLLKTKVENILKARVGKKANPA